MRDKQADFFFFGGGEGRKEGDSCKERQEEKRAEIQRGRLSVRTK